MTRLKIFLYNPVERPGTAEALPFYALEHIESGTGRLLPNVEIPAVADDTAVLHASGDVRFGKLRPYLAKTLLMAESGTGSGELLVLRPRWDVLDSKYLHYLTLSKPFVGWATATSYGVKMPRTNWDSLASFECDVPTLDEQRALAGLLDDEIARIDLLLAEQRHQLDLIEEHRHALVSQTVGARLGGERCTLAGALETLPRGWQLTPLRFVATIQGGITLGKKYEGPVEERPYIRVANVQDGGLDLETVTTIEVPGDVARRHELRAGDVLMTEGGDNDKLGRGTVWNEEIVGCLHQNHVFAIRPHSSVLRPHYLAGLTTSAWGRAYFTATAHQTTNLASTNRSKIGSFPVPLPPVGEQDVLLSELGAELKGLDGVRCELSTQVELLLEHRQALITAAVTGGLNVLQGVP